MGKKDEPQESEGNDVIERLVANSRLAWKDKSGKSMSFAKVCAYLVKEPWNCSMEQIANLTIEQINLVYFYDHENDKPAPMRYIDMCKKLWQDNGKTEEEKKAHWDATYAAEYGPWEN